MSTKIIDKWYIGFNYSVEVPISVGEFTKISGSSTKKYPMGFMVPDGTDSSAKKRKSSVDRWSDNISPKITIDSTPVEGYRLIELVGRYSRDSNQDKWKIFDPRGFVLEITSGNLITLLQSTDIIDGKFTNKCLWVRDGANNRLVVENSPPHKSAIANTIVIQNKVTNKPKKMSKKDLVVGTKYKLDRYSNLIYLGEYYTLEKPERKNNFVNFRNKSDGTMEFSPVDINNNKKSMLFLYETVGYKTTPSISRYNSVPNISSVVKTDCLDNKLKNDIKNKIYKCTSPINCTEYLYSTNPFVVVEEKTTIDINELNEKIINKDTDYVNSFKKYGTVFYTSKIDDNSFYFCKVDMNILVQTYQSFMWNTGRFGINRYNMEDILRCVKVHGCIISGNESDFKLTNKVIGNPLNNGSHYYKHEGNLKNNTSDTITMITYKVSTIDEDGNKVNY